MVEQIERFVVFFPGSCVAVRPGEKQKAVGAGAAVFAGVLFYVLIGEGVGGGDILRGRGGFLLWIWFRGLIYEKILPG